jgi:eukaryotic-like serine/threonine-protein kinase
MATDTRGAQRTVSRSLIGNYEVVRKLATGGMGEVYLAHQTGPVDFRRQVVLKKLHPRFTKDPQFVAMFLNEARIAANLAHPNIIHIYELFEDGDGYVIAMEYVRGASVLALLRALQRSGTSAVPYGPLVRIATSVCEALYYAYNELDVDGIARHVIHRDVNPSNVLVGYDGQVKLVDFGIAKVLVEEGVTHATTIKGKYGYLTPEQIRCQQLDQRSDLFSLGTMLWEMSVGKRLFRRDNEMQMMYAILEEPIPLPSEHIPDYPQDLERVVMKALARERDERYADANALADDLRAVARDRGWPEDKPALGALLKDVLPDEQIAFGQIGSDPFALSGSRRRDTMTGEWADADSFASMVVIDSDPDRRIVPAGTAAGAVAAQAQWWTRSTLVTIAVLLVLSAVFWIWIVPLTGPG